MIRNLIADYFKKAWIVQQCSICCEKKPRGNLECDSMRPSQICYDCWYQHIYSTVQGIGYRAGENIMSPFNNARSFDVVVCLNSLKSEHAQKVEEALFLKYSAFTPDIQKCPAEDCDYIYVGEKCQWGNSQNVYNCPKCFMPLQADNGFSVKKALASLYLLLASKCPRCQIPIQKISGCPHMTCPCGHHFCWYCFKDHPSGPTGIMKRIYTLHTVNECLFIFISKILLLVMCFLSLLVTFCEKESIQNFIDFMLTVLAIIGRSLLKNVIILIEVMVLAIRKKRIVRATQSNFQFTVSVIVGNAIAIALLYLLDELAIFIYISIAELLILGVCGGVGYTIIYSIETWFQFIA